MNYEEARKEALRKLEIHRCIEMVEPSVIEYDELVVEAIEKQTPKKLTYEDNQGNIGNIYRCPSCFEFYEDFPYCPYCGQKIEE